ncbi:MAG: hypothetical protein IPO15_19910 [Anaerolineae bacterium]|uniref:hypothetical protein n=1 Tax=Candidatus Amarolinea dominans TaxID=3140696 RepID=UPI0031358073|nr:hypothetical protein [Anaerolineae bacterium]
MLKLFGEATFKLHPGGSPVAGGARFSWFRHGDKKADDDPGRFHLPDHAAAVVRSENDSVATKKFLFITTASEELLTSCCWTCR